MRGLELLLDMRTRGYRPSLGVIVCLHAGSIMDGPETNDPAEAVEIDVPGGLELRRIDFRPVVGLRVAVISFGASKGRIFEAVDLLAAAGAAGVIAYEWKTDGGRRLESFIASHNPWTEPVNEWLD